MRSLSLIEVRNASRQTVVCQAAFRADTLRQRMQGLLGLRELAPDSGLLISPSTGVHTFGMKFPIDVVALDREMRVIGLWHAVRPGKMRALSFRTRSVLELACGRASDAGLEVGDQLAIAPVAKAAGA